MTHPKAPPEPGQVVIAWACDESCDGLERDESLANYALLAEAEWSREHYNDLLRAMGAADTDEMARLLKIWNARIASLRKRLKGE